MPVGFPLHSFFGAVSIAFGACIGSFLNVCVYRIPRDISLAAPRSFCPACKSKIPWYWNIPLVSFVVLGGHCRYCGARISARYFVVEALTALLFWLVYLKFLPLVPPASEPALGLEPARDFLLLPVYWLVVSGLIAGTFIDFEHLIIPDRITLGGIIAGLVLSTAVPSLHNTGHRFYALYLSAVGAGVGWGLLWLVAVFGRLAFKKEAMGFGDVKLLGAIGAFLGWRAVLFTVMLSSLAGSVVGMVLVALRAKRMQSRMPYGPYLALAAIVWVLWGPFLWDAWLAFLGGAI
ncbi:MAG: prepilin peptidase [Kiritimatiellia bacterium]